MTTTDTNPPHRARGMALFNNLIPKRRRRKTSDQNLPPSLQVTISAVEDKPETTNDSFLATPPELSLNRTLIPASPSAAPTKAVYRHPGHHSRNTSQSQSHFYAQEGAGDILPDERYLAPSSVGRDRMGSKYPSESGSNHMRRDSPFLYENFGFGSGTGGNWRNGNGNGSAAASVDSLGGRLDRSSIAQASVSSLSSVSTNRSYASVAKEDEDPVKMCAKLKTRILELETERLEVSSSFFFFLLLLWNSCLWGFACSKVACAILLSFFKFNLIFMCVCVHS